MMIVYPNYEYIKINKYLTNNPDSILKGKEVFCNFAVYLFPELL